MEVCAVCGVKASQKCSGCNLIFYCSRDHQVADWKNGHKKKCKCFDIESNDTLGKFMIASRDIKAGEIIIKEKPCVIGPKTVSHVTCLGCQKQLLGPLYWCSKCTWPVCSKECENSSYHVDECKILSERNFKSSIKAAGQVESSYCVIVPLRLILLKKLKPALFKEISSLESHLAVRKSTKMFELLRMNLVPFIRNFLQFTEFSEEEILRLAGILDTNCFEVFLPSKLVKVRGIYPKAAMMAHDCRPNTKHFFDEDLEMKIIATTNIKRGEMILTSYTHPLRTTVERRMGIKQAKCFDCLCSRCKDPTEMKTFSSCLKCRVCKNVLTSRDPLDNFSKWRCSKCDQMLAGKVVLMLLNGVRENLQKLDKKSVESCEQFLKEHEDVLPEWSVFMVDVKYALCMLYGNIDEYNYEDLSLEQIKRKLKLCVEMKDVLSIFEPGISNSVLNCQFELTAAKIMLAKRESKDFGDLMTELQKPYDMLVAASENKTLFETRLKRIKTLTM